MLRMAEAIRPCLNGYLDISYSLVRYAETEVGRSLAFLVRHFDRRTIFGSDFPEITPERALAEFERLSIGLPADKRRRIRGENLAELLGPDRGEEV
jgi:predicted TIM-barrel fold metal-dependent hydrolase